MHADTDSHSPLPVVVDRDSVRQIKARFNSLNQSRLSLAKQHLSQRQQHALECLPLLLHFNHPRLPGYQSKASPAGFGGFSPSADQLQQLKRLARGFRSQANPGRKMPLLALYVMGSVGTVAQSQKSDMDFWLCHSADLSSEALTLLQQKCEAIALWAKTLGLEWHFFLMQPEAFNRGHDSRLSSESSGSVQHFLLLDEFYRSAILLVGRLPLWWFIGDTQRTAYEKTKRDITHKGFLRDNEWLDFGPVGDVPAAEFVSAAIWQLYKSIHSPYKSLLKLLVLEVYLSRYPQVQTLSDKMKLLVYTGVSSAAALDPYLLLLRELTEYFIQRKEFERLELMRQCFYFKVEQSHSALTLAEQNNTVGGNLPLLQALREWDWQDYDFDHLDRSDNWNAQQVLAERKRLVAELTASYRLLLEQARATQETLALNNAEIAILGRKLHAAFERSAGKIEFINPGISKNVRAQFLLFEHVGQQWQVFLTNGRWEKSRSPLTVSPHVSDLVAWCYFNGICGADTRVKIAGSAHYSDADLQQWLSLLRRLHEPGLLSPDHAAFTQAAHPTQVVLLLDDPGQAAPASAPAAPTRYTLLVINSWGEVRLLRFGEQLQELLQWFSTPLPDACSVQVAALGALRQPSQAQQFDQLVRALRQHMARPEAAGSRLLVSADPGWVLLEHRQRWHITLVHRASALWQQLATPLASRGALRWAKLGETKPYDQELAAIAALSHEHAIHLFYRIAKGIAELYLRDERGSLVRFQQRFHNHDALLKPLHHFIRACLQRNPLPDCQSLFGIFPVAFYELHARNQRLCAERRHASSDLGRMQLFNLQIAVRQLCLETDPSSWTLEAWLNGEPILPAPGTPLLSLIARQLLAHRRSGQRYPCYITDLDLTPCAHQLTHQGQLQTSHFFRVKIRLEQALFQALLAL